MIPNLVTFLLLLDSENLDTLWVLKIIYPLSFMPSVPTTILILKYTTPDLSILDKIYKGEKLSQYVSLKIKPVFNPKHINESLMWIFIVFEILIWFVLYAYLS